MSRFVLAAALTCAAPAFAETAYFSRIDDVPIAPGLAETAEVAEFTDGSGVRIISTSAQGRADAEQVRWFYQEALPQLGWALSVGSGGENETVYLRGREQLSLSFFQRGEDFELDVLLFSNPPPSD